LHQSQKTSFINRPVLAIAMGFEELRSWRKPWLMGVSDAGNLLQEIGDIWVLGEAGELASAVQANINRPVDSRFLEQTKKLFGSFSRKSDRA